jgi:beta-lactamase regulating signal transducer with metallopeptidase domain
MVRAVCAMFWFHPLVWLASRRHALEAERACDDAVVQDAGNEDYAEQLVSSRAGSRVQRRRSCRQW